MSALLKKDIEVDTEGSFSSRLTGLAGTLGPSAGGENVSEMCSGVKLLVLPGKNRRQSACRRKFGLFWFPEVAVRLTPLLSNRIFLIMASNAGKISSTCRPYFQELCENLVGNRF